ncbi:MAG: HAL/PAL/TAL family ammonia-lyase [Pseudonocardiaceae bacterium]
MTATQQQPTIVVGAAPLTIDDVVAVARRDAPVAVSASDVVRRRINGSRQVAGAAAAEGRALYGVTTRFGGLARDHLGPQEAIELQNNAVWVHKTGLGRPLERSEVRASMLVRMNSLLQGYSGVRFELIERFANFLNHGVTPTVHEFGSIGASGDLVPLSYVAGALIGSSAGFEVEHHGRRVNARDALEALGLPPIVLEAKEGLALINGVSVSTASAALSVSDVRRLTAVYLGAHALMIEALGARLDGFEPLIHALKPHPGQIWAADRMRRLLAGSKLAQPSVRAGSRPSVGVSDGPVAGCLIQDPYSIRCLPQFVAPIVEGIRNAGRQIEIELNSVSDNPLIDPADSAFYHGGNFLGQVPALALDRIRHYVGLMAKHLDVQIALLMAPEFSRGLPASLVGDTSGHVSIGLKGLQITGNSIMPYLSFLGSPVADRFPTHAEQFNQNINSQSHLASRLSRDSLRAFEYYLGVALVIAVQAVDLRSYLETGSYDACPVLAPATSRLYQAVRTLVGRAPDAARPLVWDDCGQELDVFVNVLAADLRHGQAIGEALGTDVEP